ncbi:hypothetical protein [Actinophytocola algeriensis]|uniref:Uncharacterized protein n=1 Tax=Actinophytocola algeriensis TaxID=1768010 RepID=A0A7W7VCG0_9PSEU|nr:hypothetical protein [Actinophytocola algeriensis]MBE1476145.1 hypothetical protein [Actinophytocola algeriensis]
MRAKASSSATASPGSISSVNRRSVSGEDTTAIDENSSFSGSPGACRSTCRGGTSLVECSTATPIGQIRASPSTRGPSARASPRARYPP